MTERIKELILKEGLSPGSFADAIGVQRSSISHILNGRNNPSLDMIIKMLQKFPGLNSEWLLMGIGDMYDKKENTVNQSFKELSIFDPIPAAPTLPASDPDPKPIEKEEITPKKTERFVDKVLIFYSDHTYDEYKKATE